MQQRYLSRAWKTKPWMKRLSGLTLEPSTAARGVASWIASLPGSRANPSASPANEKPKTTSGGSGQTWRAYLAKYDRNSSSWKTCQGSLVPDLETFSATWPRSGTMRNGVVSERPTLVPAIGGNGGSAWQTPRAIYGEHPGMKDTAHLTGQAQAWPTPQAHDAQGPKTPEQIAAMRAKGHGVKNLNEMVANWPTPTTRDHKGPPGRGAQLRGGRQSSLPATVRDAVVSFPPGQAPTGPNGSPNTRTLNPLFVEALMGWAPGWTDCERAVTGLSRFKQRMRGALLRNGFRGTHETV